MDNKGFTLIELVATIVLLALVMSIAAYSITSIIRSSKKENYNLLITNIKDAAELYYQECKYVSNSAITCNANKQVTLGELVTYGYLKGNSKVESGVDKGKFTLVNPIDNIDISGCIIVVEYDDGKINVSDATANSYANKSSCPSTSEYSTGEIDDGRL